MIEMQATSRPASNFLIAILFHVNSSSQSSAQKRLAGMSGMSHSRFAGPFVSIESCARPLTCWMPISACSTSMYCLRSSLIIVLQLSFSHRLHIDRSSQSDLILRSRPPDVHRDRLMISRLSLSSSSKLHSLHSGSPLSSASLLSSFSSSPRVFLTNFLPALRVRNGLAYSLGANRHTSARIEVDLQTELFHESCFFTVQSSEMFFTCLATMQSTLNYDDGFAETLDMFIISLSWNNCR